MCGLNSVSYFILVAQGTPQGCGLLIQVCGEIGRDGAAVRIERNFKDEDDTYEKVGVRVRVRVDKSYFSMI